LSNLAVADVHRLVEQGAITPDLSVRDAHALVRKVYPKAAAPKSKRSAAEEQEPDWREGLGDATVNLNMPEQVALWVMEHGGILWTKELSGRDINPTFLREDGTRIDKLAQYAAEAQGLDDQQAVADKILDALNHRSAIWREDERAAAERDETARAAHREEGKDLQRFMFLLIDLGFRTAAKRYQSNSPILKSVEEAKEIMVTLVESWKPQ
jgi:hypothetical protein